MIKSIKYFLVIITLIGSAFSSNAENLKAYFTYCTFNSPSNGPYIETYLSVIGNSVAYKAYDNEYQGVIEITYIFKQGTEIKKYKKYNLLSPKVNDIKLEKPNFVDQQRISLPNGTYEFDIIIRDTNSTSTPFKSTQLISLNYQDKIDISDIELVESINKSKEKSIITKSGYDILPYTSDFYPENFNKLAFYAEIYNTEKILGADESFLINYAIESSEANKITGNYKGFIRAKAKPVNIILKSFSIDKLPSGNYNLMIEVRNKSNELLSKKKIFFQRNNPQVTPIVLSDNYENSFVVDIPVADLKEYINSLYPISSTIEISFAENQLKGGDEVLMRQFFYNFWITRNEIDPQAEWKKYNDNVKLAQKEFHTSIKKGYETDRGRVFLHYGKPNTRTEVPSEPNSYPYEIWHYYSVDHFNNIKFVFYSPDVITNDYPLLHSNLPREIKNPQWKVQLHKRTNQPIDMTEEGVKDSWGDRSGDYYNSPR